MIRFRHRETTRIRRPKSELLAQQFLQIGTQLCGRKIVVEEYALTALLINDIQAHAVIYRLLLRLYKDVVGGPDGRERAAWPDEKMPGVLHIVRFRER